MFIQACVCFICDDPFFFISFILYIYIYTQNRIITVAWANINIIHLITYASYIIDKPVVAEICHKYKVEELQHQNNLTVYLFKA
jgi:hypothetical protein